MNQQSAIQIVTLEGELDIARRAEIRNALVADAPGPAILVDLSNVSYADSTTIAEMLRFRRDAEKHGRKIALLINDPQFARVIQYAGLADAFAVFEERGAALTYLSGAS